MTNISRTTLRELKKRYSNVLKKCLLANLMAFAFSLNAYSGTATDTSSLIAELEKNERTVVEIGTHILTYDKTSSLYDAESDSIIFPNVTQPTYTEWQVRGGKFGNLADVTFESDLKLVFKDNFIHVGDDKDSRHAILGNTIYNTGTLTFNAEVDFLNNHGESAIGGEARVRGAVYNEGTLIFKQHVNFKENTGDIVANYQQAVESVGLYNKGGTVIFETANFIRNQAGSENNYWSAHASAVKNTSGGKITFKGETLFEDNKAFDKGGLQGAVISNKDTDSIITFLNKTTFKNNKGYAMNNAQAYGGAIMNGYMGTTTPGAKIEFADVDFIGNKITGASDGIGGAIVNRETIIFNGTALFQGNESEGQNNNASGGAIYNSGNGIIIFQNQAIFKDNFAKGKSLGLGGAIAIEGNSSTIFEKETRFLNNKAEGVTSSGQGGALRIGWKGGSVTFKEKVVFQENLAKGITALGGAIALTDPNSILDFENGFHFEGNKEITVTTDENGVVTETEKLNDIYMKNSIINIKGTDPNAEEYIGGGIRGAEGMGTINKSSVATLVFGEESDSTGFTGVFNQTAGKTVARSETFLGGINNIDGGELETHGNEIKYTAIVGGTGRLTHFAMGGTPVEIKGLSFKEEGTNLSMTFKNGRYQLKEEMMNAKGNTLSFERADLSILNGSKNLGTIIAKDGVVDVGTNEVNVDSIDLKENSTLQLGVNSLTEHGKVNGTITGSETSEIALIGGLGVEKGVYQLFDRDNTVNMKENAIFNIKDLENGSYEISKKTSNELSSSLEVGKNEGKTLFAIMEKEGTHTNFQRMQSEVLNALQSQDAGTVAKAKKSLNALGARSTSVYQSQATAQFTQMHTVITQMLMNSTAPIFGHAGGEDPARATVYVKGLYDRVNSLAGDGFRMRSKGAVLGIQSAITEDLTVGIGYAGINSVAKEPLRRTEVDTNTGFISAQYQPNNWWVNGVVTYSRSQYDEEKNILSTKGSANYDVDSLGAQITTGYNIKRGDWIVTPEVGVRYLNARQEGYVDSLGTTVEKTTSDFVTTMAGFKVGVDLGWMRPLAGVMVGYDVVTDDISAVNTLASGATYTIKGKALDRLSTTVVAGFAADIADNATLKLEYSGNYRKEYLDHSGMGRLELRF